MYEPEFASIIQYLLNISNKFGSREAFIIRRRIKKEKILYKDIQTLLNRFNVWFDKNNIKINTPILFWGTNSPEYSISLLSCMALGRIAVPVDFRNSEETIGKIIEKTKPKHAFISKYFKSDFLKNKNIKIHFIEDILSDLNTLPTGKIILTKNSRYVDPNRIVEIVFTSGTTGTPKGVVMKQKNILANLKAVRARLPDLTNSRTISILPLSHMLEQVAGLLLPISYGATIYYLPRINSFRLTQAFSEYKPTHLVFVPQMLKMFWEKIEEKAKQTNKLEKLKMAMKYSKVLPNPVKKIMFSSIHDVFGGKLKFIACGGAPLDKNIGEKWFGIGIPVIEGYGATEITAVATMNMINSPKLGTVGKPISGVEINLDVEGEIYIKSKSVAAGYFKELTETKTAFTKDGYKTGDIGEFDKNGNLRILGRDVFKIVLPSGEKVFVEDLERKILEDKRIKETCVIAKRTSGGDKIHAYFILRKDVKEGHKGILSDINNTLESKQQISSFDVWPEEDFPRTPTLKIDRKLVFDIANNDKDITLIQNKKEVNAYNIQNIVDVLSKVSGIAEDRINDSDTLSGDLSIDSLTRVEVIALAEEHLGIILDETKITAKTTVKEIKEMAKSSESIEDVKLPDWQFSYWGQILHFLSVKYFLSPLHSLIIKIKYPQHKVPKIEPGSIIIFNHPGILDGVCVLRTLQRQKSFKVVTNSGAYFWTDKTPFFKPLELFTGGIPLYESGHGLIKVLQTDSDLLDKGYNLLFAPQGRLQTTDEEDHFKLGIGYIIQQLNCPVYIIKIKGYRDIWPTPTKGFEKSGFLDFLPRKKGTVNVKVSKMIKYQWENMTPIQITNLLEEKYREL